MNEIRKIVVLFMACMSTVYGFDHYSGKTFLMPRTDGSVDKALELATWHTHLYTKHPEKKHHIKSHFQIAPFYKESLHEKRMGEYFGIGNCSNCFVIGDPNSTTAPADIDSGYLIHNIAVSDLNNTPRTPQASAKICFAPKRRVIGTRLDFFQDINSPIKGLFFKATLPLVYVEHKLGATFCDEVKTTIGAKSFGLRDFFTGGVNVIKGDDVQTFSDTDYNPNLQSPLKKLKFGCGHRSAFGIADIDVALGYKYLFHEKRHCFLSVGFTIPTGTKIKSEYLFEPVYGNGFHFGIFATADAGTLLWEGKQGCLRVDGGINFKYLFEGTETRVLGLKGIPFGQYYLGGKAGQDLQPLFPLANVLCRDFRVKPGHQIDAVVDFSFHNKNVVVDVGYNMYWKDKESLWEKEPLCLGQYGIALQTYNTEANTPFGLAPDTTVDKKLLTNNDLDFDAAKTPDYITHKLFASVGYKCMINDHCPTSLSVGGSYEFAQTNAAFEQWGVWGKVGFSF